MKDILVVDDAPEVCAWMRVILEKAGWRVHTAANGVEACNLLSRSDIRVVITDWMMPVMDGIALIEWIRERKDAPYVYTLLMTARGSEEDNVLGLSSGADDYLVKPSSAAVLSARLSVATRILDMQQRLLDQQAQDRESRDLVANAFAEMTGELQHAASQQRATLPGKAHLPAGIEADWRFRPANNLSGDHLDVISLGERKLAFYLLDVSGHGVSAALRSAAISELLRPISPIMSDLVDQGPHKVLEKLNRHMCQSQEEVEYLATLVLGVLDTRTGVLEVSSAGHPNPMLMNPDGSLTEIRCAGLPLGVMADVRFDAQIRQTVPGQVLIIHSDGVTDCRNPENETYSQHRLRRRLRGCRQVSALGVIQHIERDMDRWRGARSLEDDATLLAIHLKSRSKIGNKQHPGLIRFAGGAGA